MEEQYAKREGMNLLYVAITRAKQALLVSGNGKNAETEEKKNVLSWYDRIAQTISSADNPMLAKTGTNVAATQQAAVKTDAALQRSLPTGKRASSQTLEQRRGTWLHGLLQQLSAQGSKANQASLQAQYAIPAEEMGALWQQAQALLVQPQLQRFFNASHYLGAHNEMAYVNAQGELKRIDRLVEFGDEVWILDYKTGANNNLAPYRAQMNEYRNAMQSVYANKTIRCALIFSDGKLSEL